MTVKGMCRGITEVSEISGFPFIIFECLEPTEQQTQYFTVHLEAQGEADFSTCFKFIIQFPDALETFRKEIYTVFQIFQI